jgi:hypothetical protein
VQQSVKRKNESWIELESQLRALVNAFPGVASLVVDDVATGVWKMSRRRPIWPNYWHILSALIHYRP